SRHKRGARSRRGMGLEAQRVGLGRYRDARVQLGFFRSNVSWGLGHHSYTRSRQRKCSGQSTWRYQDLTQRVLWPCMLGIPPREFLAQLRVQALPEAGEVRSEEHTSELQSL